MSAYFPFWVIGKTTPNVAFGSAAAIHQSQKPPFTTGVIASEFGVEYGSIVQNRLLQQHQCVWF